VTYLVQLIEVAHDYNVIGQPREYFFSHLPATLLFLFPSDRPFTFITGLSMIAAEERISAEYDILRVHPILFFTLCLILEYVGDLGISTPGS
jgi:hypothetical protein